MHNATKRRRRPWGRWSSWAVAGSVVATGVAPATSAGAVAPNYFYPNTTTDQLDPASSCLYQSTDPCSLRDAIALAGNYTGGDAYVVPASGATYTLTLSNYLPVSGTVVSPAHTVTIEGDNAVIDDSGNGGEPTMAGGGGSGPAYNLELDNLTLTGTTDSPSLEWEGKGNLTLSEVTFSNNHINAGAPAGLLVGEVGTLTMNNVTFTGNHGTSDQGEAGAEIHGVQNSATLTGVDFDHNKGQALTAMFNSGPISLDHVLFEDNTGSAYPTLELNAGTAGGSLENVDVEGNVTTWQDPNDPTVALYGSFSTLDAVTIANNVVGASGGGAMLSLVGTATATNWTVSGNQVQASSGTVPIAGGIDVEAGSLRLNHATIADNSAGGNADDLHTGSTSAGMGSIIVLNSIIAGSSAGGAVPCAADGGPITSAGHNIDEGKTCGFGTSSDLNNTNPRLGLLVSHPGYPAVRTLLYGSPAVNAADSNNCPATDAIGTPRPQGVACDIGAFESPLTHLAVTVKPSATSLPAGGGNVTYRLDVSNLSGVAPQDVQLTDQLPAGAKLVSVTSSSGTCVTNPVISCSLGLVRRGADAAVTLVARLSRPGKDIDTAHVQSELPDSDMSTNNASATTLVAAPRPQKPALSGLSIKPRSFRPRSGSGGSTSQGTTISYVDSEAAKASLEIQLETPGVLAGGKCTNRKKSGAATKVCEILTKIGTLSHTDHAGRNAFGFSGVVGAKALVPGTYLLTVTASVPGAPPSAPVKTTFQVTH